MGVLAVAVSVILVVGGVLPAAVEGGVVAGVPTQATVGPACAGWGNTAVAVGSPRRSVDGVPQAGVVELHYRSGSQWEVTTLTSPMLGLPLEANGWFGASVALFGDVQSGCRDLVIGMPGANQGRGAVVLLPDLGSGLVPSGAVLLPTESVSLQPGDRLGTSLATLGWCCEAGMGWQRIAAGAPGRDAPGAPDAGAVLSWRIPDPAAVRVESPVPLTFEPPDTYVQGSGGLQGRAERNDRFGSVLSEVGRFVLAGLSVGIPDEDIGTRKDAGAVAFLRFTTTGVLEGNDLLWQGSGLPGKSRAGDRAGAAVLDRHIGVPGKEADGRKDSGAVLMWDQANNRYQVVTQNSKGVPDTSERGDAFGSALAGNLLVGVPGEDAKGHKDAGSVIGLRGRWFLAGGKAVRQRAPGLAAGDRFGAALVYQDYSCGEDVYCSITLIGAPGDDRRGTRNTGAYYSVETQDERIGPLTPFARGTSPGERFGGFVMNTLLPM